MRVVPYCPFPVLPLLWQPDPSQWRLTVAVKATFRFVHGHEATLADPQEPLGGDTSSNDAPGAALYAPSDWVPHKPRADILLVGHAYAPAGIPVKELTARLEAGGLVKSVRVTGDRVIERVQTGTVPGRPTPFTRMPLRGERGPRSVENPHGIPWSFALAHALPNLDPLGFGPIAPSFTARRGLIDDAGYTWAYRLEGPPPRSFDFGFFNVAPRDQQIDRIPMGGPLRLENLQADHPIVESQLPELRPRAFLLVPAEAGREVELRCDTLWIDADRGLLVLTWRGVGAITEAEWEAGVVAVVVESAEDPDAVQRIEALGASDRETGPPSSEASEEGAETLPTIPPHSRPGWPNDEVTT